MPGDRIDSLSRLAATPMPRRRMLVLGAGVVVGATVFPRPSWAGGRPTNCQEYCASGTPCPPEAPACCCVDSSETAGAWVVPIGGACHDPAKTRCCPVKRPDGSQSVVYCNARVARCGAGGGGPNCECIVACGDLCCPPDTECRGGRCYRKCPPEWTATGNSCCPPGMLPTATGCKCASGQVCKGDSCCPFGYVCGDSEVEFYGSGVDRPFESRRVCVGPPDASGNWDSKLSYPFLGASGIGTRAAPRSGRRATAAAAPPFALAMAAVSGQGAAALAAWATPQRDRSFRARVKPPRVAVTVDGPPELAALLNAEAKANALLLASGRARSRSLGAIAAGSAKRAFQHAKDSGRFAGRAGTLYASLPERRAAAAAALRAAGVAEVSVGADQALAFRSSIAAALPGDLAAALARLGLTSADRRRVQARLAAAPLEEAIGAVLIAPLEDTSGNERFADLASDLRSYATSARLKPLNRATRRARAVPQETTDTEQP